MNSQQQKMKLQQKLTPQQLLVQKLLQLPGTQLDQRIKEEVEKNPLLEVESESPLPADDYAETGEYDEDEGDFHGIDLEEYWDEDDYAYREHLESDRNSEQRNWDSPEGMSFADYLLEQLNMRNLTERQRTIGIEIIGSIDGTGYLGRAIALITNDLALRSNLEASDSEVEQVLHIVQQFDPAGVGARSLQECLSLQLHRIENQTDAVKNATTIVEHHFGLLANRRYDTLMAQLHVDEATLNAAIKTIQHLNPKPGWGRGEEQKGAPAVIPDFVLSREGDHLSFTLTDKNRPKLQMSSDYLEMLDSLNANSRLTPRERQTVQYLKANREEAEVFIGALNQREQTLRATMSALVKMQRNYFLTGRPGDLKPMRLKDVAEMTGYDESTLSRVVNEKYVETPFGTFRLKELFSKGVTTEQGDVVGLKAVKEALQEAVDHEDKRNPLTDEALTALLKAKGYPLSRRTVAKYREAMQIPVARLRKRL